MPATTEPDLADEITTAIAAAGLLTDVTLNVKISKRRKGSMHAAVEPGGTVITMNIASDLTADQVLTIIRAKAGKFAAGIADRRTCAPQYRRPQLIRGEGFRWLGASYRLEPTGSPAGTAPKRAGGWLHVPAVDLAKHGARPLIGWYRESGTAWVRESGNVAKWWAALGGQGEPPTVRVGPIGRKRWSKYEPTRNEVVLGWHLFQLPMRMVHLSVVHELAHAIPHPGRHHGPEFWRLVRRALPEYERLMVEKDELGRTMWMGDVATD